MYVAAIDFRGTADEVVQQLPRGRAYLADQLQRAATSIVLHIAEGAGELSSSEKGRFYRIANALQQSRPRSFTYAVGSA